MAFSTSVSGATIVGNKRLVYGTYTQTAATDVGGTITSSTHGLNSIIDFTTNCTSHVDSIPPKYAVSSGTITLVTPANTSGTWKVLGN